MNFDLLKIIDSPFTSSLGDVYVIFTLFYFQLGACSEQMDVTDVRTTTVMRPVTAAS